MLNVYLKNNNENVTARAGQLKLGKLGTTNKQ